MLTRLADFLYAHRPRGAVRRGRSARRSPACSALGGRKHLSPYGANDPATQSVQATNRFQAAAGRQIDPGVVALVDRRQRRTPAAKQRVDQVAAELAARPDVASVASFYDTHNPAMVSRDGRSTYVVAYFKPLSDPQLKDDAQQIENRFAGQRDVKLGGRRSPTRR